MSTFKIRFSADNIRKISIQESFSDFTVFNEFLLENYSRVLGDSFVVKYRDEDGDLISVTCQIEWETMFHSVESQVIELIIGEQVKEENKWSEFAGLFDSVIGGHGFDFEGLMKEAAEKMEKGNGFEGLFGMNVPFYGMGGINGAPFAGFNSAPFGDMLNGFLNNLKEGNSGHLFDSIFEKFESGKIHLEALRLMQIGDEESLIKAGELLHKAIILNENDIIALYNLACVESLLGNVDEAIFQLMNAINEGYNDIEHMMNDPDLENIRYTEGFNSCLDLITSNTESNEHKEEKPTVEDPLPEPELSTPVPTEPEETNEDRSIIETLADMGIFFDQETISELTQKFGNDLDRIVNYYFNTH
eukprot:TRINITY_DN1587_c0_g1_i1.p1 TRINITY_DN1587_c0_g1~~TRINITY_DN1587_c0_g1_i1.p1  ORF type:complete len:360 (+),score=105.33 TRINITY_DN1587_c0_g1_i1:110-1189(+)